MGPHTRQPAIPARSGGSIRVPSYPVRVGEPWDETCPGVVALPSGRLLRGRGLRRDIPDGPLPEFGLYLLGSGPVPTGWETRWLRWHDHLLPRDRADAQDALRQAWLRAGTQRVEIACHGGRGRTGTALACIAVLDGAAPRDAVAVVRAAYDRRAIGTPWQRRYVTRFRT